MNKKVYPGKLSPRVTFIVGNSQPERLTWSQTWNEIERYLALDRLQHLPEPEKSIALASVGFYSLVRGAE